VHRFCALKKHKYLHLSRCRLQISQAYRYTQCKIKSKPGMVGSVRSHFIQLFQGKLLLRLGVQFGHELRVGVQGQLQRVRIQLQRVGPARHATCQSRHHFQREKVAAGSTALGNVFVHNRTPQSRSSQQLAVQFCVRQDGRC